MKYYLYLKNKPFRCFTIFWVLVLSFAAHTLEAQEVKLQSKIDQQSIVIGDPIELQYQLTFDPTKFRIQLPTLADTFNQFEVVEQNILDSITKGEALVLTQTNIITHFDSGAYTIPAQQFTVTPLTGGTAFTIRSDTFRVLVQTVAVDTSQPMKPIFDIIAAERPWWDALLYPALALLGLILLILLFFFIRKTMRQKNLQPKQIKKQYISPWDDAEQKTRSLVSKTLWLSGEEKEHHTELTDIIRTYIEEALGLDCFEKTSQEIITDVKKYLQQNKYKKRSEELEKLRTLFFTADLVKFAKSKPTELEHEQSNQAAFDFINRTKDFLITQPKTETPKAS